MLVIEDEPAIADFIQRGLEAEGYSVSCAGDGIAGERLAIEERVDLVVLDRMLPGRDGLDVLAAIRAAKPTLPVIVLSARAQLDDRVEGLDAGATDYLPKPFSFAELAARLRAHLRSTRGHQPATGLSAAGIELNLLTRRVTHHGEPVHLSAREFDLLAYFVRQPGQALRREQILSTVWGYDFDPGTNVVEVYVRYLRRKLSRPGLPAPIETIRSVGYRLRERD